MSISLFLATCLLDVGLTTVSPAPPRAPHPQDATILVRRGYELLPDARWRQELVRDQPFRIGIDFWVSDRLYLNRVWVSDISKPDFDLLLEVERFTARDLLVYRPVRLVMPHRPDVNERFMFEERGTARGAILEGLFYGVQYLEAIRSWPR